MQISAHCFPPIQSRLADGRGRLTAAACPTARFLIKQRLAVCISERNPRGANSVLLETTWWISEDGPTALSPYMV